MARLLGGTAGTLLPIHVVRPPLLGSWDKSALASAA